MEGQSSEELSFHPGLIRIRRKFRGIQIVQPDTNPQAVADQSRASETGGGHPGQTRHGINTGAGCDGADE
jgi:hypothetical protein